MPGYKPFVHLFRTYGAYYLYDVNRNVVARVGKTIWNAIKSNDFHGLDDNETLLVKKMREDGFLSDHRVKEIMHPADEVVEYHLNNKVGMLTLQITQQCNLRCDYCIYSGNYITRTHSIKKMDFNMAKKGIDFLIKHSSDNLMITLGFYGGEPLLEFDLIRKCIDYAEEKAEGKEILFTVTTNGTLLDEVKAAYFEKHKLSVLISLDGPKEVHDKSRRFAKNAASTFDIIIKNVDRIKEKFPDLFKMISFNAVLDQKNNFSCVNDFFADFETIKESNVMSSGISELYSKTGMDVSDDFYVKTEYEKFKLFLSKLGNLDPEYASKLISSYYNSLLKVYMQLKPTDRLPDRIHHGGPCIPGAQRLFLSAEGIFFPCERVSEKSEVMKIGEIDAGFYTDKVKRLLNVGKLSEENCKNCWAYRFCILCAAASDDLEDLSSRLKLGKCENVRRMAEQNLMDICALKEMGASFTDDIIITDFQEEAV